MRKDRCKNRLYLKFFGSFVHTFFRSFIPMYYNTVKGTIEC